MKKIFIILPPFLIFFNQFTGFSAGEDLILQNKVYKKTIKSVQFHRAGWELTYPIMELNGIDKLELSFDDLADDVKNYSYTMVHCSLDWQPSQLSQDEYIDGFQQNQFYDYELSFNTYHNYIHYRLVFPNNDIQFKISGNYIIKVFEDFNEDQLILTKRFTVVEPLVSIDATVKRPVVQPYSNTGHKIDFTIYHGNIMVNDPYSEISVTICQNNRWDNAITNLKPLFVRDGTLEYNYQQENIFPGGNEYRYFDMKSLRYQSEFVKSIEYRPPYYHVLLFPDQSRSNRAYFFREDLNGKFFIDIQEGTKSYTEADYVYVHFTLSYDVPLTNGDFYVFGALTNWSLEENNKMSYNYDDKAYELTLLLKQGFYNYQYVFAGTEIEYPDESFIEGNHYETENDYIIYVYHRSNTSRYDHLIGFQIVNSVRK